MNALHSSFYFSIASGNFQLNQIPAKTIVAKVVIASNNERLPNHAVKIPINRDVGLKVELKYRFTFTDYIDDVSGVYFQNNVIAQNYGTTASYFADPAIIGHATHGPEDGDVQGTESFLAQTFAGQIRGDATDKDGYMIAMLSVYKKIYTAKRSRRRKTIRRVKASF